MSLLAELVTRFATSTENLATEALGHLCRRSPACRAALVAWATDVPGPPRAWADEPDALLIGTQHTTEDGAIPDLVGTRVDGTVPLMVEAKFDAGLTDNQPNGYLPHLTEDGALVFLVPRRRRPFVHSEVKDRLAAAGHDPQVIGEFELSVGNRLVRTETWERLLARLESSVDPADEPQVLADVRQLAGLAVRLSDQAFVPLLGEELTGATPHINGRIARIHGELHRAIRSSRILDTAGLRTGSSYYGMREVIFYKHRGVGMSVSWDNRFWAELGATPWWVGLWESDADHPAARQTRGLVHLCQSPDDAFVLTPDQGPVHPLHLPPGLELDAAASHLLGRLVAVSHRFADAVLGVKESDHG